MVKPQFGLVLLPVLVGAIQAARAESRFGFPSREPSWPGAWHMLLLAAPLLLDPLRYADQLYEVTQIRPMVSLFALNPWGLLVGFEVPDGGLALVGLVLFVLGLAAACVPVWRRRDLEAFLVAGVLVAFAFYFLPTRVHERYLFPALAVLVPFAVVSWRAQVAYLGLSAAFGASLLHALVYADPDAVPEGMREFLRASATVWVMGVVLIGSAAALVWLLLRGAGDPLSEPRASPR